MPPLFRLLSLMCIFICVTQSNKISQPTFQQELGKINFFDPDYIKDAQCFTGRSRRGDSYKSNLTVTTLQAWGNNVSMSVFYVSKRTGNDLLFKVRCCDAYKHSWMEEFIYSFILKEKKKVCPFPATTYKVANVEIPPKNFPVPLPKGEAQLIFILELTESKHVIFKFSVRIKS